MTNLLPTLAADVRPNSPDGQNNPAASTSSAPTPAKSGGDFQAYMSKAVAPVPAPPQNFAPMTATPSNAAPDAEADPAREPGDAKSAKKKSDDKPGASASSADGDAAQNLAFTPPIAPEPPRPQPAPVGAHHVPVIKQGEDALAAAAQGSDALGTQAAGRLAGPVAAAMSNLPAPDGTSPKVKDTAAKAETSAGKPDIPAAKPDPSASGTPAAPKGMEMKSDREQIEIAGQAAQKLPLSRPVSAVGAAGDGGSGPQRLPIEFSSKDAVAQQWPLVEGANKAALSEVATEIPVAAHAVSVDNLEQLMTREVMSFKQAGAAEVGVSLRIDSQTQLLLQLTSRDGQTQAFLRCEKGDFPALSSHWGQLQESLARQNVQLQPSGASLDGGRQDAPSRRQPGPQDADDPPAQRARQGTPKPKSSKSSRPGWESWA